MKNRSCNLRVKVWRGVFFLLASGWIGLFSFQAFASDPAMKDVQEESKEIQRRLKEATSEIESITQAETQLLTQLEETERLLNQIRKKMTLIRNELQEITTEIGRHQKALAQLKEKSLAREKYVSERLVALYKLSCLGQLPILATSESGMDFVKRKKSLEYILDFDRSVLDQLWKEKETLNQIIVQLNAKQSEKKKFEMQLRRQKEALLTQYNKRNHFLAQIQARKSLQLASIAELKAAAKKLDQTILELTRNTSIGQEETSLREKKFSKFKGLLNLPVKGKIIYFYGRYKNKALNVTNFRTGITIQADRGEPIHSVGDGIVIYANWFKGYGNMIILDHGNHYYTVYAHVEEMFKHKGDRVEANEVIATVGDTGIMGSAGLHFEVRHHGKPLDPMEWIRKG